VRGRTIIDLTGQRFGGLVVRQFSRREAGKTWWLCDCTFCGDWALVDGGKLKGGQISCGCQRGKREQGNCNQKGAA
jgi:hypothetical protein